MDFVSSSLIINDKFDIIDALEKLNLISSRSEAKRIIKSGGIKINTVAIICISIYCNIKGRFETSIFGRQIPIKQLYQSISISVISIFTLVFLILLISLDSNQINFSNFLFDTTSAFGTVGATTSIIDKISNYGKTILIISMFTGRILPFSFKNF